MLTTKIFNFDSTVTKRVSAYSSDVKLINCYPVVSTGGRSETVLVPSFGSTSLASCSPTAGYGCRGLFRSSTGAHSTNYKSTIYGVFGNSVFRYSRTSGFIKIGNVNLNSSGVTFAENQDQLNNSKIYVCDGVTIHEFDAKAEDANVALSFKEIAELPKVNGSNTEYAKPNYITYEGYRLIFSCSNSNQWFYSGLNDSTFNSAKFFTAESNVDKMIRIVQAAGNLWSFGEFSYEIWNRSGNASRPYVSPKSNTGKMGLASADSIGIVDDLLFFLASGDSSANRVMAAGKDGGVARISDDSIEELIAKATHPELSKGFCFVERGQIMYALSFIYDDFTLVYNATTKRWHTRSTWFDGKIHQWFPLYAVSGYNNQVFVGSSKDNTLNKLVADKMTDYLNYPITRTYQSPVVIDNLKSFKLKSMILDVETGTSGSYTEDSKVIIEISWNSGKTWSQPIVKSLGKRGNYKKKVELIQLGYGKDLVISVSTSDPEAINLYQYSLSVEGTLR